MMSVLVSRLKISSAQSAGASSNNPQRPKFHLRAKAGMRAHLSAISITNPIRVPAGRHRLIYKVNELFIPQSVIEQFCIFQSAFIRVIRGSTFPLPSGTRARTPSRYTARPKRPDFTFSLWEKAGMRALIKPPLPGFSHRREEAIFPPNAGKFRPGIFLAETCFIPAQLLKL